jgi:two-component sensor histidine kinase
VMSIAAVQRHLALSDSHDVALRAYFSQLCESLAASMISDPALLSILVDVDESHVDADKSVSLGLIVTELVINALKHAYPEHGRGKIVVGYRSGGSEWRLWVKDDGVGMSFNHPKAKAGLGSGIVDAPSSCKPASKSRTPLRAPRSRYTASTLSRRKQPSRQCDGPGKIGKGGAAA